MSDTQKNKIKITEISLDEATFKGTNSKMHPTNINFIYGKNGTGKSTIGRIIEKTRENNYVVWKDSVTDPQNTIIQVYNEEYISRNLNSRYLNGVFTISEKDIKIEEQIISEKQKKENAQKIANEFGQKAEGISNKRKQIILSSEEGSWKIFKASPAEFLNVCGLPKGNKLNFFQELLKIAPTKHDKAELDKLYKIAFDVSAKTYSLLNRLNISTLPNTNILSSPIIPKSNSQFSGFMKKIEALDWVKKGHAEYESKANGKCPYCQQPLTDEIIKSINECFDNSYDEALKNIKSLSESYDEILKTVDDFINTNNSKEWYPQADKNKFDALCSLLHKSIESIQKAIVDKLQNPSSAIQVESLFSHIDSINSFIDEVNSKIAENNGLVSDTKKKENFISAYKQDLAYQCATFVDKYNESETKLKNENERMIAESKAYLKEVEEHENKLIELQKYTTSTKPVIDMINNLLRDSGFQGFRIEENREIKNTYKTVYIDGTPAEHLSEGEKNFICFLYFFFSVIKNPTENSDGIDRVVVIDDPVSSMDSDAVFVICSLIREIIAICKNAYVYDPDLTIDRHIKQVFILTHNAFFYNEIAPLYLKDYAIASFFEVTKINNKSSVRQCLKTLNKGAIDQKTINELPHQSSYSSLWEEYKTTDNINILLNTMRRILEIYFLHNLSISPSDLQKVILIENKENFIKTLDDGSKDSTALRMATSMLCYLSSSFSSLLSDLYFTPTNDNINTYKSVFKQIFECMNQNQHYKMMARE